MARYGCATTTLFLSSLIVFVPFQDFQPETDVTAFFGMKIVHDKMMHMVMQTQPALIH